MAVAEPEDMPDTSKQEAETTKVLPPGGRITVLGREKNAAQLRGWCQICGDAAYNRNFGALSCDSCKAFFRRNVTRTPFGRCEGKCEITIESRTFCKKCRFNKCLTVGMKRHLVKGRGMKEKEEQFTCDSTASGFDFDTTSRRSSDAEESLLLEAEIAATLSDKEVTALIDSDLRPPFSEMMTAWQKTYGSYMYNDTNKPQMVEIMNLIEGPLKTLVSFAKNLPRFKSLPVEDQISLLKGCAAEAAIIRSALSYDPSKNGWEVSSPGGKLVKVSADVLKSNAQEVFQSVVKYYQGVQKTIKGDGILVYFMITLSLFSSDREKLNKPEVVQETQQLYASILQNYCRIRHPAEKNLTARVLMKTVDIRDVGNCAIKLFQSADNDQLRPLLHEIFDLPQGGKSESTSAAGSPSAVQVKTESSDDNSPGVQSQNEATVAIATTSTTQDVQTKVESRIPTESFASPQRSYSAELYTPPPRLAVTERPQQQLLPSNESHPDSMSTLEMSEGQHRTFSVDSLDSQRVSVDSRQDEIYLDPRSNMSQSSPSPHEIDLAMVSFSPDKFESSFSSNRLSSQTPAPANFSSQNHGDVFTSEPNSPTNIKLSGLSSPFNIDYNQPPAKASRIEDNSRNNSVRTFSQVSPPVGVSRLPFQNAERRLSAPDTSSLSRINSTNISDNFPSFNNVVFDFTIHKRGHDVQHREENS